jgi:hypothetical protein
MVGCSISPQNLLKSSSRPKHPNNTLNKITNPTITIRSVHKWIQHINHLSLVSGSSKIMTSVVNMRLATLEASTKAVLTTLVGSMMPNVLIYTYLPLAALNPRSLLPSSSNLAATKEPSYPAFWAISIKGILMAF